MAIIPRLTVDGFDASDRLISCHAEMTSNARKDPGKYDLVLSNIGGVFYGAFSPTITSNVLGPDEVELYPKRRVDLKIWNVKKNCKTEQGVTQQIFTGDIQRAECDEFYCRIEGSCTQGGWSTAMIEDEDWNGDDITTIVNALLDRVGFPGVRHIVVPSESEQPPEMNPNANRVQMDFDTAMNIVAQWAQCIYFFDEADEFWFIPPQPMNGAIVDLDGKVLRGTMSRTAVGYCTAVRVFGGSNEPTAYSPASEVPSHEDIVVTVKADPTIIAQYGVLWAPALFYPSTDIDELERIGKNLLAWYDQYRDVPTVKAVGVAPGVMSLVSYSAWNNNPPPTNCPKIPRIHIEGPTTGIVTRRVIDISVENGYTCTLEVTRNYNMAGTWGGAQGVMPLGTYDDGTVLLTPTDYDHLADEATWTANAAADPDNAVPMYNGQHMMFVTPQEAADPTFTRTGWSPVQRSTEY